MLFKENLGRRAVRTVAGLVAAAALASCGGGTYQIKKFTPTRILTFGDESNTLYTTQGLKYSINGISGSTNRIDCSVNPLWTQILAASYNMVYQNCNSQAVAEPTAFDLSTLNATVADTAAQITAFGYENFTSTDLVTIWVGVHDVLNDFNNGGDPTSLDNDMTSAGNDLAVLVKNVTDRGAKVILLTIPDMGRSPFAAAQQNNGNDPATVLNGMSDAFNSKLRTTIPNDGSKIGLVLVDNFVNAAVHSPGSYGLIDSPNVTAGCTVALPDCSDLTVALDAGKNSDASSIYLWADDVHLAPIAHNQIGSEAVTRAHGNPF